MNRRLSPSGRPICPPSGPLDADIIIVSDSPTLADIKGRQPLTGLPGRLLNKSLLRAGIDRDICRILHAVPAHPAGSDFERHSQQDRAWGINVLRGELRKLEPPRAGRRIIVCLGNEVMDILLGVRGIARWRGSLFPPAASLTGDSNNEYWTKLHYLPEVDVPADCAIVATYHPKVVAKQMPWHVWLNNDLTRAKRWTQGLDHPMRQREWFFSQPTETERLIYDVLIPSEHMVAIDTEIDPPVVSLVSEQEAHAFVFTERYRRMLTDLMASPYVLKVAHNQAHDWRQFEKIFDIPVARPTYDTLCGAHIMEPSGFDPGGDRQVSAGDQHVGKSLSPHIATKFTPWPFHKWLVDIDPLLYCGIDTVVCYDAYWTQMEVSTPVQKDLMNFDSKLFHPLFDMQRLGIRVDTDARKDVIDALESKQAEAQAKFLAGIKPHIESALSRKQLRKPHLFKVMKQCSCCGGGKLKSQACPNCLGLPDTKKPTLVAALEARNMSVSGKVADLKDRLLSPCAACDGVGKVEHWLDFNMDSSSQVGDLFYRALGVPVRRFQGKETTRIDQLERMLDHGAYLGPDKQAPQRKEARRLLILYSEWNRANTERETAERIAPDVDGRIRCNFDLWYTPTHRVASREGLLDVGTNLQNIPKDARRLLIPDDDHFFMYIDYAQVEGRSMAVITKDEKLREIYLTPGGDSHQAVADLVTASGTPITRDQAKRTFFATCYGIEAGHLSTILGCTSFEAQAIINAILRTFPGIRRMHEDVKRELRSSRSVTTLTGWRRRWLGFVLEERGRNAGQVKDKVLKEGLATKPQYMGARVMAEGLLQLVEAVPWVTPLAHIHDACLVQAPLSRAAEAITECEKAMTVNKWDMWFPVDACCGPNWYVASVDDKDKPELGYNRWTRAALLA